MDHGEFHIEVIGAVVHTYPVGGFNEYGIQKYQEAVLEAAKPLRIWALFEHPKDVAALTPEAIKELTASFQLFANQGCIAIADEIGATFGAVLDQQIFSKVDLPTLTSGDNNTLTDFIAVNLNKKLTAS